MVHRPIWHRVGWQQHEQTPKKRNYRRVCLILIEPDGSRKSTRTTSSRGDDLGVGPIGTGPIGAYRTLVGALGAADGAAQAFVAGLSAPITPHYGVLTPTRHAYLSLLDAWDDVRGCRVLDVGCGTGVLSFLLLSRGAASAVATDLDPRSVVCANEKCGITRVFQAIYSNRDRFISGQRNV